MLLAKTLSLYKQAAIQDAMVEHAAHKEIAVQFGTGFGKRPDALTYPSDILENAKKGATSFHASEELWSNPLSLTNNLKRGELDQLRKGWDLILDIDTPQWILSKLTTHLFIKALQDHGIKAITCKFSGNKGFHIAVPFEAFPSTIGKEKTADAFPEGPRKIALYLLHYITENYVKIKEGNTIIFANKYAYRIDKLAALTGKKREELITNFQFNPLAIIDVDTILISSRHLYRMPYSFHEKSGLVSLPIDPDSVLTFTKKQAEISNVNTDILFLDRTVAKRGEAAQLVTEAYDFASEQWLEKTTANAIKPKALYTIHTENQVLGMDVLDTDKEPIPEEYFPECIQKLLQGLEDGRKRALFVLTNFLQSCHWEQSVIEERLKAWNQKNKEPLKDNYLITQLHYARRQKKAKLPPNCNNKMYYADLGIKCGSCAGNIKNPVQYASIRFKSAKRSRPKTRKPAKPPKSAKKESSPSSKSSKN